MNDLDIQQALSEVVAIMTRIPSFALISSDACGRTSAKAMATKDRQGISKIWFVTHRSSRHAQQLMLNPASTLFFNDTNVWEALMLTGQTVEETDVVQKEKCWRSFYCDTFTKGINDPEYLVLRFEVVSGNFSGRGSCFDFVV